MDVGALGAKTVGFANSKIDSSRLNGFRIMKTEYWLDFYGKTAAEGPIQVGFCLNMGTTEVEGSIEADPQDSTRDDANNQAKRPVFPLEMIEQAKTASESAKKGSFNPRWSCPEGQGCAWWAYNMDSGGLTTGMKIIIFAKHYGVWLRD